MQDANQGQSSGAPLIPDQIKGDSTQQPLNTPQSGAPDFFAPDNPSSGTKTFGGKKIIATLLGVLLLVGGLAAGTALVLTPQLFNQKAANTDYFTQCSSIGTPNQCVTPCHWVSVSCSSHNQEAGNLNGCSSTNGCMLSTQDGQCSTLNQTQCGAIEERNGGCSVVNWVPHCEQAVANSKVNCADANHYSNQSRCLADRRYCRWNSDTSYRYCEGGTYRQQICVQSPTSNNPGRCVY